MSKRVVKLVSVSAIALIMGMGIAGTAAAKDELDMTVNKTASSMTTMIDDTITLKAGIMFKTGSAVLSKDGKGIINERINKYRGHKTQIFDITVTGYADKRGSVELNQKLSQNRAQAVADYIASQTDIPLGKIIVKGMGKSEAVATTAAGMAKERIVVIHLVGQMVK
jgi:outer membrane protein OmpA-like peptidoglycan-associated protein